MRAPSPYSDFDSTAAIYDAMFAQGHRALDAQLTDLVGRMDVDPADDRLLAVLADLAPGDWARPTECTGWSVHDMAAHVLGAARGHASTWEFVRQAIHGRRAGRSPLGRRPASGWASCWT